MQPQSSESVTLTESQHYPDYFVSCSFIKETDDYTPHFASRPQQFISAFHHLTTASLYPFTHNAQGQKEYLTMC